jgi:uncharacterized protein
VSSGDESVAAITAIRTGDTVGLRQLLLGHPGLASSRLGGAAQGRTPLHVVCDWPGYFPNGPRIAGLLIEAGADLNARSTDQEHGETPLHWTASSDDADVAAVLVEAGADLETPGGSIGTPLANAIGYHCWNVARLLVASGARVDALWHAAALGLLGRLGELLADSAESSPEQVSQAFWHACAGGQRRAAEMLLAHGADLNWSPGYADGTPLDTARGSSTRQDNVTEWLASLGARSAEPA